MFYDSDEYWGDYVPEHRSKNFNVPAGIHVMNKNESTALRKLKKETGLTEEELRKEKKISKDIIHGTKTTR